MKLSDHSHRGVAGTGDVPRVSRLQTFECALQLVGKLIAVAVGILHNEHGAGDAL